MPIKILIFLIIWTVISQTFGYEQDLTVSVDPGKSDCFFQKAKEGDTIDIEFQVIDGTRGTLDVGFLLSNPNGRVLVALTRRQSGVSRAVASATGNYRFCFDNTHSTISSKTVYFDLLVESDDDDGDRTEEDSSRNLNTEDLGYNLVETADRVALHLSKVRRLQDAISARSSRDDHAVIRSLSRVTFWSALNALAILCIGALQVIFVRSLFEEKSRVHTIWNKLPFS